MLNRRAMSALSPVLAVAFLLVPTFAEAQASRAAGAAGRAVVRRVATRATAGRALSRAAASGTETRALSTLARDLRNHRTGKVVKLPAGRTVSRYTTLAEGRAELRRGIPPMRHLTSRGGPGRPLNAANAKQVLGLQRKPGAVLKVHLPKGQPVILNRIPGGAPGRGELVSPRRIPPSAVKRLVPLGK